MLKVTQQVKYQMWVWKLDGLSVEPEHLTINQTVKKEGKKKEPEHSHILAKMHGWVG